MSFVFHNHDVVLWVLVIIGPQCSEGGGAAKLGKPRLGKNARDNTWRVVERVPSGVLRLHGGSNVIHRAVPKVHGYCVPPPTASESGPGSVAGLHVESLSVTESNASLNGSGRVLPLRSARRRMPLAAFALNK